jgi:hypothetical protein
LEIERIPLLVALLICYLLIASDIEKKKYARSKAEAPVRVSPECFGGDVG